MSLALNRDRAQPRSSLTPKRGMNPISPYVHSSELARAIERDDVQSFRELMSNPHVDPSANRNRALRIASSLGRTEYVKILLEDSRVDPMEEDECEACALTEAAQNGHVAVLRLLLQDKRCDPSAYDNEAIASAAWSGNYNAVMLLLSDPRIDPSAAGNSAVVSAIDCGHEHIQKLLLADLRVAATWTPR